MRSEMSRDRIIFTNNTTFQYHYKKCNHLMSILSFVYFLIIDIIFIIVVVHPQQKRTEREKERFKIEKLKERV